MRVNPLCCEPRFPKRIHGRVRIFCRPLRVADTARFASAAMAPTSRSVKSPSPARRGRFCFNLIESGPDRDRGALARYALPVGFSSDSATTHFASRMPANPSTEEVIEGVSA